LLRLFLVKKPTMPIRYDLALDLGTTHTKALALDTEGRVLAQAQAPTHTLQPQPGYAEQDPLAVVEAAGQVLRRAGHAANEAGGTLGSIVLSSAMHSMVAMGTNGQPLTHLWLWSDTRASAEAEALRSSPLGLHWYRISGVPIHAMSPLCKWLWLRQHQPKVALATRNLLDIKSFFLKKICNAYAVDYSVASATGFFDLQKMIWSADILQHVGLHPAQLPDVVSPSAVFFLKKNNPLAVPAGTPVVVGASDGALANLGSGATDPTRLSVTIGTSGAVRILSTEPYFDPLGRTFCYRLDERRFIVGGASNNGSNVLDWVSRLTACDTPTLLDEAQNVPPGSMGLRMTPHLHGERAPLWDAHATAHLTGLTSQHTRAHLARAAVEGVVANLHAIGQLMPQSIDFQTIILSGGANRHALWAQELGRQWALPVEADGSADASALGAIRLLRGG
jgi:gluconokinase